MRASSGFHAIMRTSGGNLALYHVGTNGRTFCELVETAIRFPFRRRRRLCTRLTAAMGRHGVEFLRIEGDVKHDAELSSVIEQAFRALPANATKTVMMETTGGLS